MKKMRLFLMGPVACFAMFATLGLTSCNKEDVTYNEDETTVLYAEVDGSKAFGDVHCVLCGGVVAAGRYHCHTYPDGNCPVVNCTHAGRSHWHIFANGTQNATWFQLTTHFGGLFVPFEGEISDLPGYQD